MPCHSASLAAVYTDLDDGDFMRTFCVLLLPSLKFNGEPINTEMVNFNGEPMVFFGETLRFTNGGFQWSTSTVNQSIMKPSTQAFALTVSDAQLSGSGAVW